jgi:hypothetical protein
MTEFSGSSPTGIIGKPDAVFVPADQNGTSGMLYLYSGNIVVPFFSQEDDTPGIASLCEPPATRRSGVSRRTEGRALAQAFRIVGG